MKRREALLSIAGGVWAPLRAASERAGGRAEDRKTRLGVCVYCLGIRAKAMRPPGAGERPAELEDFFECCRRWGAGGIQAPLGAQDGVFASSLRRKAESSEMFIEGIAALPRDEADVERFDAELRTAKQAGADVIRVVAFPGRRYERFESAAQFREFAARGLKSLQLAEPAAARRRVRLALENHKDQRVPERLEWLRRIGSQHVGACVDTGNSLALLEDPMEVVEAYAPWAFSAHLKDQAVRQYEDGFLLADAPLGAGFLDLAKMVRVLLAANPTIRFSLEVITRDPLKVPCLTEEYWTTLRDVPGRDLARTLRAVRSHAAERLLQVSGLPLEQQVKLEEDNVKRCLAYARDRLRL